MLPVPGGSSGRRGTGDIGQSCQDICQPGLRVDVVHLGGDDQGIHEGGALAATGQAKSHALPSKGDPHRAGGDLVGLNAAVVEEAGEGLPATVFLKHVVDGLGDRVVLRHPGALTAPPFVQVMDHWRDLPLTCVASCHGAHAGDPALSIEDGIDAFDGFQRDGRISSATLLPFLAVALMSVVRRISAGRGSSTGRGAGAGLREPAS